MNEVLSSFGKDGEGVIIADITPGQVAGALKPIPVTGPANCRRALSKHGNA
jgi:hypothetical protein